MNVSGAPRVLALVPAWNGEEFIGKTLGALAAQTYEHVSILISDDASTDSTLAICRDFAATRSRVQVISQPVNRGWIGNVNALFDAALQQHPRPDMVFMAFHDDVPSPRYVEACVEALNANPPATVAYTDMTLRWQNGDLEEVSYPELDGLQDVVSRLRSVLRHEGNWWAPLHGVMRIETVAQVGGLQRHRRGEFSADWPWTVQLAAHGVFVRAPENQLEKVYLKTSLSRSWDHFNLGALAAVTEAAIRAVLKTKLPLWTRLQLSFDATYLLRVRIPIRLRDRARGVKHRLRRR
jgi:glycosyltransferase involved in cell wall biosynthesis